MTTENLRKPTAIVSMPTAGVTDKYRRRSGSVAFVPGCGHGMRIMPPAGSRRLLRHNGIPLQRHQRHHAVVGSVELKGYSLSLSG